MHSRSSRFSCTQDKDLFVSKMALFRPKWDDARVDREWSYLEALTPEHNKKHGGPAESPLQLPIPGWFVGDDGEVTEHENFESKQISTAAKAAAWKPEDLLDMHARPHDFFVQ